MRYERLHASPPGLACNELEIRLNLCHRWSALELLQRPLAFFNAEAHVVSAFAQHLLRLRIHLRIRHVPQHRLGLLTLLNAILNILLPWQFVSPPG